MKLRTMLLKMESDKPIRENTDKLRGFFANKFINYLLLHNHLSKNKFLYKYPRIQYKTINRMKVILGIEDGVNILQSIYDKYDQVVLDNYAYQIFSKEMILKEEKFGVTMEYIKYKFLTPWFALNEDNYRRYKDYNHLERANQLRSILIRNIMAIAKTFQYFIGSKIMIDTDLKEVSIEFKRKDMIGFIGTFQANFELPDYIGLGKSVSRGFGTIKRMK